MKLNNNEKLVVMRLVLVVSILLVVGCTEPNPKSCADNHCSDPALPYCDVDGSIGGRPNTCIAVSCTPDAFEVCRGDSALACNATGDNYELKECEFGCGADRSGCIPCETPECEKRVVPKYLPTICEQLSPEAALTIAADTMLDTSQDSMCTSIVPQAGGPDICVLHYGLITIDRGKTLTVTGTRVLALVADRDLLVDGTLDVSASGQVSGPGGGFDRSGTGQGNPGGGAGYRHAGGSGASTTADGGAANGGPATAHPSTLASLLGGTRAVTGSDGGGAGGAGGAATLISCRGTTTVSGLIDAGGGGGYYGALSNTVPYYRYPSGGGSGGTVVMQGLQVEVTGEIYANGGGGGGGGILTLNSGNQPGPGADGTRSMAAAPGGSAGEGAGPGGAGGTNSAPQVGARQSGTSTDNHGGAGGGSAGFILVYAPQSATPTLTPVAASPMLDPVRAIATN